MKTKHTPGPWRIWPHPDGKAVITDDRLARHIAVIPGASPHWQADAHLLSAAPELLESLKGVLRVADRNTVEFNAAKSAIAKAEGIIP